MKKREILFMLAIAAITAAALSLFVADVAATVTMKEGEIWNYKGMIEISLLGIEDSRCPPSVQCIWAGEISALLKLKDLENNEELEARLGTLTKTDLDFSAYKIKMINATAQNITLSVRLK